MDECNACGSTNIETLGLVWTRTRRGTENRRISRRCRACGLAWYQGYTPEVARHLMNCGNCADVECANTQEAHTKRTKTRDQLGPCNEWRGRTGP